VDVEDVNDDREQPAAGAGEYYLLVCLIALVVTVLALSELRLGARLYAPYMVFGLGVVGLVFRLPSGPPLMLLTSTVLVLSQASPALALGRGPQSGVLGYQLLFCAGMVAFTIAYYRRLAVEAGIFPGDTRRALPAVVGGRPAPVPRIRRAAAMVPAFELIALPVVVITYTAAGYLLWKALERATPPRGGGAGGEPAALGEWRLLILMWVVIGLGVPVAVAWGYLNRALASPTQNLLCLQDELWAETMSEQGRANRLLTRGRLRKLPRKEKP
jgi:hypothetical protein